MNLFPPEAQDMNLLPTAQVPKCASTTHDHDAQAICQNYLQMVSLLLVFILFLVFTQINCPLVFLMCHNIFSS